MVNGFKYLKLNEINETNKINEKPCQFYNNLYLKVIPMSFASKNNQELNRSAMSKNSDP